MGYAAIKGIHMLSVTLSYLLFFVRGIWMIQQSPLLQQRWVRIVPHVIDTILLASALTLAAMGWLIFQLNKRTVRPVRPT